VLRSSLCTTIVSFAAGAYADHLVPEDLAFEVVFALSPLHFLFSARLPLRSRLSRLRFPLEAANAAAYTLLGSGSYVAAVCWHVRYNLARTNAVAVSRLVDFCSPTV